MDIEQFREYCLSFEEVTEKTPFGKFSPAAASILVFYVCGHMFCMVNIDNFAGVTVKNTPECIAEMHETRESCRKAANMSAKYWIELYFGGDITEKEILSMVEQSYTIVRDKYSGKRHQTHKGN